MTTPVTIHKRMSQSMINQGDICMKRIEFDFFHDTPELANVNRGIGSGYHAGNAEGYLQIKNGLDRDVEKMVIKGLESFTKGITWDSYNNRPVDEFSWVYQPKTYRAKLIVLNHAEALLVVEQLIRAYWEGGHAWTWDVVAVEFGMNLPYPGAPEGWRRGGAPDLIVRDDLLLAFVIVDHKTSKKKWAKKKGSPNDPQAAWYIDAWRTYANTDKVKFVYDVMAINLDPDSHLAFPEFERHWALRSEAQIHATLERGKELAKLIDQGGPFLPNTESFLCSPHYCDYWNICPYGSTLNLIDESLQEGQFK